MSFEQRYYLSPTNTNTYADTHRLGDVYLYNVHTNTYILFDCSKRFQGILTNKHSKWAIAICNHSFVCVLCALDAHITNGIHIVLVNPFWQQTSVVAEK